MKNKFWFLLLFIVLFLSGSIITIAQTVGTITLSQNISGDGIAIGDNGDLYVAGGWNKNMVYGIDMEGNVEVVSNGLTSPVGLMFKPGTDTLLVSNWQTGIINTLSLDGVLGIYANLQFGPGGMVFDSEGYLYVAHNKGNSGQGGISKVGPDGSWTTLASGGTINNPVGLIIDENEDLYCANLKDARITRVDLEGNQEFIATVPGTGTFKVGNIAYLDGNIYATALSSNKVYKVTLDGEVSLYAGTGVYGFEDGPALQATFTNPNGICFSNTGDTIFVRETLQDNNRIRFIYDIATSVENNKENDINNNIGVEIYPNPIIDDATIHINILKGAEVNVSVYDVYGKIIERVVGSGLNPGHHKFKWTRENLQSGICFCRIKIGNELISRKIIIQ